MMVFRILYILIVFVFLAVPTLAQEDESPPVSPRFKKIPKENTQNQTPKDDVPPPPQPENKKDKFKTFNSGKRKVDFSKFIIEPNFILSLGANQFHIGVSPYVGYRVWQPKKSKPGSNDGLYLGGGFTYYYTRFNLEYSDGFTVVTGRPKFHTYGGGVFAQYNIWRGFFARAKFELLHLVLDDINNWRPVYSGPPNPVLKGVVYPKVRELVPALLIGGGYNLLQSRNFFFPVTVSYNVLHNVTNSRYSPYRSGWVVQLGFINLF
ncbi:MAG: hypothetical protein RMJ53_02725 [Chitinophagales bacterium]|nr:hypothetical protein [Chitinophagales bacterium]MDW8273124.1 hypothetical protein [Chitinophagales bacterium]